MDSEFKGKVALVTGGSRGIGRAISRKFASLGADVVIDFFRNRPAAEQTAKEIEALGVRVHIVRANIGDPEKVKLLFDEVKKTFGKLDILVSNAASGVARTAMELDAQGWDWTMNINARALLFCAQEAAKLMEGRGGKIVSISSLGSQLAMGKYVAVGVSKAALEALTRYLAIELAPKNICVNAVAASAVETEALKLYTPEQKKALLWQSTPAGRIVIPEDVAGIVAFLCSDAAFMIRGQTLIVDGGVSIAPVFGLE
ncbi:MAG: enoyl-[acyl-carrier-protein] reductase FabL [Chloroflexota bacterium]